MQDPPSAALVVLVGFKHPFAIGKPRNECLGVSAVPIVQLPVLQLSRNRAVLSLNARLPLLKVSAA